MAEVVIYVRRAGSGDWLSVKAAAKVAGLGSNCSLCEEEECSQIAQVSLGTYGGDTCWKQLCGIRVGRGLPDSNCVKLQPLARSSVLYCIIGSLAKFQRYSAMPLVDIQVWTRKLQDWTLVVRLDTGGNSYGGIPRYQLRKCI